jgi:hypothetical protein
LFYLLLFLANSPLVKGRFYFSTSMALFTLSFIELGDLVIALGPTFLGKGLLCFLAWLAPFFFSGLSYFFFLELLWW